MKLRTTVLLFAIAGCLASAGCIVLPVPVRWKHQYSYSGFVLDRETGQPVANATVSTREGEDGGGRASAVTDETGAWTLPEVRDWHFGYICAGWNDGTCLPSASGQPFGQKHLQNLTVSSPGYRTLEISDFHEWNERKWFFDNGWLYEPHAVNPYTPGFKGYTPMSDPAAVPLAEQLANVSKPSGGTGYVIRLAPLKIRSESATIDAEAPQSPAEPAK